MERLLVLVPLSVVAAHQPRQVRGKQLQQPLRGQQASVVRNLVAVEEVEEDFKSFVEVDEELSGFLFVYTLVDYVR